MYNKINNTGRMGRGNIKFKWKKGILSVSFSLIVAAVLSAVLLFFGMDRNSTYRAQAFLIAPPYGILTGEIKDKDTQTTIPDAVITAVDVSDPSFSKTAFVSSDGRYTLDVGGRCGKTFTVKAEHKDYETYTTDIYIECYESVSLDIELERLPVIDPVIVVPGILGSWNLTELKFLLFKKKGVDFLIEKIFPWFDKWYPDPLLGTYTDLIKIFDMQDEYEKDKNFFVFTYDWRNSNIQTARLLKDKIQEIKDKTGASKVDIIAHSMGGLITRYYVISDLYQGDVDQVVFLGTPHRGAPKAYLTWEGGYLGVDVFSIFSERIFLQVAESLGYDSIFEFVREYPVFSVQQLLPDYTYLSDVDNNKELIYSPQSDDYPQNGFLVYLNRPENISKFTSRVRRSLMIYGEKQNSTIVQYQITKDHKEAPKWEHGKPKGFTPLDRSKGVVLGTGDETVPLYSLQEFPVDTTIVKDGIDHRDIVKKSIPDIYKEFTGKDIAISSSYQYVPDFDSYLFITLASPLDIQITDPNGRKIGYDFDADTILQEIPYAYYTGPNTHPEFILIPNPEEGGYTVQAQTTGEGDYKMTIDYISDQNVVQKSIEGSVYGEGRLLKYNFEMDRDEEDVLSDIEIQDTNPPVIDARSPEDGKSYPHSEVIDLDVSIYDEESGVKEYKVYLNGRDVTDDDKIDLFYLKNGKHTLKIKAEDMAGNRTKKKVEFSVYATIDSLIQDIDRAYREGMIKSKGIADALKSQARIVKNTAKIFQNPVISRFVKNKTEKIIKKMYNNIDKQLNNFYKSKLIDKDGYSILKDQIKYLKNSI